MSRNTGRMWYGNGKLVHVYPNCLIELDFHEGSGSDTADAQDRGTHTADLINDPAWETGMDGAGYYATSLNGTDEHVALGDKPEWEVVAELTVAMWVKPVALGNYDVFAASGDVGSWETGGWALYYNDNVVNFFVQNYTKHKAYSPTYTADDAWHHIAGTYDKTTNVVQVYFDGVPGTASTYNGDIVYDANELCLGYAAPANSFRMHGCIDKFAYYDRCLTAAEILAIYNDQSV